MMVREVYAALRVEAASRGEVLPPLGEQLSTIDAPHIFFGNDELFEDNMSGQLTMSSTARTHMCLSKTKSSPDDYMEREMKGKEWDEPKLLEIAKIDKLQAKLEVTADDPKIKGMPVCETMWTGRDKRDKDGSVYKKNARCVCRGDLQKRFYQLTSNQTFSPTIRNTSLMCIEAVACAKDMHMRTFDVPGAYLQGVQWKCEQMVLRPPDGFRKFDERGVEILWLMNSPLYGQGDAGAIWNRTINEYLEKEMGFVRSYHDPCVYTKLEGRILLPLYVDDGRLYYLGDAETRAEVNVVVSVKHPSVQANVTNGVVDTSSCVCVEAEAAVFEFDTSVTLVPTDCSVQTST